MRILLASGQWTSYSSPMVRRVTPASAAPAIARRVVASSLVAASVFASTARGQCAPGWLATPDVAGVRGVLGLVRAATQWDPDGPGPRSPVVALAGPIVFAGDGPALTVALWDGTSFAPLSNAPANTTDDGAADALRFVQRINDLIVYNGQLVIAGRFSAGATGANLNIAAWNGTRWVGLGTGAVDVDSGLPFDVQALGVWNQSLVAAANDGTYALTNNTWTRLGPNRFDQVNDVISFNGQLFRAGRLPGALVEQAVDRWNGIAWEGVWGNEQSGWGRDLLVVGGELYAAVTDIPPGSRPFGGRVVKWQQGSWVDVGSGFVGEVTQLASVGNTLYASGTFQQTVSGEQVANIARLGTVDWEPLAAPGTGIDGIPVTLTPFGNSLVVSGQVAAGITPSSRTPAANVIVWNPGSGPSGSWQALKTEGINNQLGFVAVANDQTFVAGGISSIGNAVVDKVAVFNGQSWQPAAGELPAFVADMTSFGSSVAIGSGNGAQASVYGISNGQWTQLGQTLDSESGFFTNAAVRELVDGQATDGLYATILLSSTPAYRWNGSSWDSVGLAGSTFASARDVVRWNNKLVIGGNSFFEALGSQVKTCVVTIDENGVFQPLGFDNEANLPLLSGVVNTLEVYNNELYAGGVQLVFTSGPTSNTGEIVRWTGTQWVSVGGGLSSVDTTTQVVDLAVFNNTLVAGGFFDFAGPTNLPTRNLAAWNGTTWSALDGGVGDGLRIFRLVPQAVTGLDVLNTPQGQQLLVVGSFVSASGLPTPSLARFGCAAGATCDSIDFNNDGSFFDPQDIAAFISVYSEGPCIPSAAACNDIDFNNDTSIFDPCDISSFIAVYSEAPCSPCGQ